MKFFRDLSLSAMVTGLVVVLVGYASSVAIVFKAAEALGATQSQVNSWMWALGIGMGVCCILPSLRYRVPIVCAWSTPGAALIATLPGQFSMDEGVGAFIVCAVLIALAGVTGIFERVMNRIPVALGAALLAGVLLRFGLDAFGAIKTAPTLVLAMIGAYLVAKKWFARYAIVVVLLVGIACTILQGTFKGEVVRVALTQPEWVTPRFSFAALVGLAIPLFIVTMVSQNMPGIAVLRANQVKAPVSPVISFTGVATLALAPFGGFALNLAAITAAICHTPEAHADASKRYAAAVMAGVYYIIIGIFGAAVGTFIAAFPRELVAAIAGLALIGTIGTSFVNALKEESTREAAMFTFLVTASGVSLLGIGAAFWGVVIGLIVLLMFNRK